MNSPDTIKLNCLTVHRFKYGSHLKLCHLISFSFADGNHRQLGQERCVSTINTTDVKCIHVKTSHIPMPVSMASGSSPLNDALYMLCAARHWSFKCQCLLQRLVIR